MAKASKPKKTKARPPKTVATLELKVAPPGAENDPDIEVDAQPLGGPSAKDLEREEDNTFIADADAGEVDELHERRDGDDTTTEIVEREE